MSKSLDFLINKKVPYDKTVTDIIRKIDKLISKISIGKILIKNPYEKLVPYNLWFDYPDYKIMDYFHNNQHLRARYIRNCLLTPLVAVNNSNLTEIKKFIKDLSLYQPFYPETFFTVWEFMCRFLKIRSSDLENKNFLFIGRENNLGTLESIIFYHEMFHHSYQYNTYDAWLTGKEKYNVADGSYKLSLPNINYLGQAYKINFLRSTKQLAMYDLITIDCNHLFNNILKWNKEELDLQANLFYIITSLNSLKKDGSMIIKLNMIARPTWQIIFDILHKCFKEYVFYRPEISNPFNSEIYLYLNRFEYKPNKKSVYVDLLKNLYRQQIYSIFYLNTELNTSNPITEKYQEAVKKWCDSLTHIIKKNDTDYIGEWHASNGLLQIKHLDDKFDDSSMYCTLKTSLKKMPRVKSILATDLYNQDIYKKIIEKRAELNYYKRIMDTKPSQIFTEKYSNNNTNYLLTWEQLTNDTDIYKNLKYILKTQYEGEMVTNAWIKMYEMLNGFRDLIPVKDTIKTFHLCEAPGAFISAVNHYISNRGNGQLNWYAQTLKPNSLQNQILEESQNVLALEDLRKLNASQSTFSETRGARELGALALEDHFGLIANYPGRWLFGDENDNSGDITHSTVIKSYVNNPLLKDIDFITSDAGLLCNPIDLNEQEAFLGKINMGQIVCILACLPIGRSAIFKTFLPMTEPLTISLMYLVTHLFGSVIITKPSSSHSSNSEVYIVMKNYKGIEKELLEILYIMLDDPKITSKSLLFSQIDTMFFLSYTENISKLINRQIQSLKRNYYYYYHLDELENFGKIVDKCIENWLSLNPVYVLKNHLLKKNSEQLEQ